MKIDLDLWLKEICPKEQVDLVQEIRAFVRGLDPEITEEFKWQLPFFRCHGTLLYINPKKDHVDVGFMWGFRMSDPSSILQAKSLKRIRHFIFTKDHQDWEKFQSFVEQAIFLNLWMKTNK